MRNDWKGQLAVTFDICGMTRAFHQEHLDAALASSPVLSKLANITRRWIGVPPKLVNN